MNSACICLNSQQDSKDWPGNAADSVTVFKHCMQGWSDTSVLEKNLLYGPRLRIPKEPESDKCWQPLHFPLVCA